MLLYIFSILFIIWLLIRFINSLVFIKLYSGGKFSRNFNFFIYFLFWLLLFIWIIISCISITIEYVIGIIFSGYGNFSIVGTEREGFEPPVSGLPTLRFSRPPPSTARPPLLYILYIS